MRSQDSASAAVATVGFKISSERIVPIANSTGDFTRRRCTLAVKEQIRSQDHLDGLFDLVARISQRRRQGASSASEGASVSLTK